MALINNIYVLCEEESVTDDVELTSHPTESGLPISDTVRKTPKELSIRGKIVKYDNLTTDEIIRKLQNLKNQGSLITFKGANTISSLQITRFSHTSNYKINGGVEFTMSLVEHKIAKSSYTAPATTDEDKKNSTEDDKKFKVGQTVLFKGGYVYVSSDAKTAAAKRGVSTCELTKISSINGATHIYHLISKDGANVYGWVDAARVISALPASTKPILNGGTQSTSNKNTSGLYYTIKTGDTIYSLVNGQYKYLGVSVSEVINSNPNCFSRPGDARTLQIGSRIYLGAR